jgi:sugar fermentation stimulation protein A
MAMKMTVTGMYILIISMDEEKDIGVGSLGRLTFEPGYYSYTGSAMGGLFPRLKRHASADKTIHWHIDFLLAQARLLHILMVPSHLNLECEINTSIQERINPVAPFFSFGASDCKCPTHLFHYMTDPIKAIRGIL